MRVLVDRPEERAGLFRSGPAPEAFRDGSVAHPERIEALGPDVVEEEGGRREDVGLGLDPRDSEDIEIELQELPRPSGLGFLVPPGFRHREPFGGERL